MEQGQCGVCGVCAEGGRCAVCIVIAPSLSGVDFQLYIEQHLGLSTQFTCGPLALPTSVPQLHEGHRGCLCVWL